RPRHRARHRRRRPVLRPRAGPLRRPRLSPHRDRAPPRPGGHRRCGDEEHPAPGPPHRPGRRGGLRPRPRAARPRAGRRARPPCTHPLPARRLDPGARHHRGHPHRPAGLRRGAERMSPLVGRPALEGAHLTGRALLLLVAMVLASVPVSQLLAGSSWLMLTLVAAVPVICGGVVLRTVMPRQMLVPLAQVGVLITLVLVVETALGLVSWQGGPLAVIGDQEQIVTRGVNELASGVPPLELGAPGAVILVTLIGLVTLLLDLMFLDLGWHTPTGLIVMSAVLIPALQHPAGRSWWQVAAPVLGGAMILSTRTVHADPRYLRGDRRPPAGPPARPARTPPTAAL